MRYIIESPSGIWLAERAISSGDNATSGYNCRPAWWNRGEITYFKGVIVYPHVCVVGTHTVTALPADYEVKAYEPLPDSGKGDLLG